MSNRPESAPRRIGSLLTSLFFILVGIVTLYDTIGYSDRDSQVFPRAAAILLIVASAAACIVWFLRPSRDEGFGNGVWWRRVLLVISMLLAGFAMPYIGFLPASAIAFAGGMIAAMHDGWSLRSFAIYAAIGIGIMAAFYALFKFGLHVPLP